MTGWVALSGCRQYVILSEAEGSQRALRDSSLTFRMTGWGRSVGMTGWGCSGQLIPDTEYIEGRDDSWEDPGLRRGDVYTIDKMTLPLARRSEIEENAAL